MNFKLVYEKDGIILGSEKNIPTEADTEIISREVLNECKLVYFVDGELKGSKTDAIPSTDDIVLYKVSEDVAEEKPTDSTDNNTEDTAEAIDSSDEVVDVTEDKEEPVVVVKKRTRNN